MWAFFLGSLPVIIATVVLVLIYLPSPSTHLGIRLDVGLAWFASLITLVLAPTDVATALLHTSPPQLATWWRAAYWYGFAVQVLVLPLHMEWARSGEFTVADRFIASLKVNVLFYAGLGVVSVFGLILLLFTGRLAPGNMLGFCLAFSNAYGLIGAIFLMGFGLVAIPRQLWRSADPEVERRRLCHVTGVQAERAQDCHRRLSVAVLLVRKTDILFPRHDAMRPYMDAVLALADSIDPSFKPSISELPDDAEAEDFFDREDLARLRGRLKRAIRDEERERALYVEAVHQYLHLERIQGMLDTDAPLPGSGPRGYLQWVWYCKARFWVLRGAAIIAGAASAAIVVAEGTIAGVLPNLSLASRALHAAAATGSQAGIEALCFALLAYPCAAAYYAIYKLGSFAFYRMVPRHTDAYSLCYSALFMSRFAAPLAFNFMAAVALPTGTGAWPVDVTATRFYEAFGELMMAQPVIGLRFTTFAPALLVPYVALLASGLFDRAVGAVFKKSSAALQFEDDWETTSNYGATGRRLLRMEAENVRQGLPIGAPLDTPTAISGPTVLLSSSSHDHRYFDEGDDTRTELSWWQRLTGTGGKSGSSSGGGTREERRSRSGVVRNEEAEAARGRLAATLGRSGGATARGDDGTLPLLDPSSTPLSGLGAGFGRSGGGGRGDGGGNIFDRLEAEPLGQGSSWKRRYNERV